MILGDSRKVEGNTECDWGGAIQSHAKHSFRRFSQFKLRDQTAFIADITAFVFSSCPLLILYLWTSILFFIFLQNLKVMNRTAKMCSRAHVLLSYPIIHLFKRWHTLLTLDLWHQKDLQLGLQTWMTRRHYWRSLPRILRVQRGINNEKDFFHWILCTALTCGEASPP